MKRRCEHRSAFILIELLVVIAIIAILSVVVILTLNPAALLQQGRDANRLSDMHTITSAVNLYNEDQGGISGYSLGTPGILYLSVPDPTATTTAGRNCAGLGFSGNYHCPASSTYRNTNGTGWIPINLASMTSGASIGSLPVDPVNTTSSNHYYIYTTNGSQYEVLGCPESSKYGANASEFINGSTLSLQSSSPNCPAAAIAYVMTTYPGTGATPGAIAFDGTNMWTANNGSNSVTKITPK